MRTLTADDVTALRTMDKVVVNIKDDSATIRVIKTMPARKGYPATESEREILADANSRGTTACFVTLFPRGEWRALALLAHAGDRLIFRVADNQNSYLRAAVVPADLVNRVVCLGCFDEYAREAGVDYSGVLSTLYFAGDRAAFVFKVESSVAVT